MHVHKFTELARKYPVINRVNLTVFFPFKKLWLLQTVKQWVKAVLWACFTAEGKQLHSRAMHTLHPCVIERVYILRQFAPEACASSVPSDFHLLQLSRGPPSDKGQSRIHPSQFQASVEKSHSIIFAHTQRCLGNKTGTAAVHGMA